MPVNLFIDGVNHGTRELNSLQDLIKLLRRYKTFEVALYGDAISIYVDLPDTAIIGDLE